MKRVSNVGVKAACGFLAAMAIGGCITPDPATLAVQDRDNSVYEDAGALKQSKERKYKVAVIVSQGDFKNAGQVATALDGALTSVVSDFAFFQLVERSNLGALTQEQMFASLESKDGGGESVIAAADYLITAKISSYETAPSNALILGKDQNRTYVDVALGVDFRFYELLTKRVVVTRNLTRKVTGIDADAATQRASSAAQECAKAFGQELGARYAPPARVVETRGNCKVARISMGSNYGLSKGVNVEFYEIADNSAIIADATRDRKMVGRGTVISADVDSAWVEVSDYMTVSVRRGDYVRICSDQAQPKGFMDVFKAQ